MALSIPASSMTIDPLTLCVVATGIFVIGFMKGAFGGGFAIIGIPLLALVMDPIEAGTMLAPLFVAMDVFALRYWKPATWAKPDLLILLPGLVAGIGIRLFPLTDLHPPPTQILIGPTTPTF